MAWFFVQGNIDSTEHLITGEDARHIEKSLRMKAGEELTLVTEDMQQHRCRIKGFSAGAVQVSVEESAPCKQEPLLKVTLYQSLTKGDKMDLIVQKSVELGVHRIVPVVTSRCVSRPDEKSMGKKVERWRKIALAAAQQSCRGIVPVVEDVLSFSQALEDANTHDRRIIFYEGGGERLSVLLEGDITTAAIFVGCEGGFDISEVDSARSAGVTPATLGKRILRAETAPLAALSAIMCLTGNMD